jgi:hypothetical protein
MHDSNTIAKHPRSWNKDKIVDKTSLETERNLGESNPLLIIKSLLKNLHCSI